MARAAPILSKLNVVRSQTIADRGSEVEAVIEAITLASRDFAADPARWVAAMRKARPDVPEWVKQTVRVQHVSAADFTLPGIDGEARVIGVVRDQIVTDALTAPGPFPDPGRDLAKIAVVERHLGTGRIGLGVVKGFGLRSGALASTVAHDAHNIVVIGMDDDDMARAVTRLAELGGGEVVVDDLGVRAELPLPVAGLLSDAPLAEAVEAVRG